ncbi:TIR domain-containing protein [Aeromonas caviae]|uniref:TIR domain-containing protein n=1 Tax=Aeromonas caviae TaxID=648 RepID=UPI0023AB1AB5|nr:TIR domain-containing protein [Aeromonas caviae]WEE20702.1 nucleotide-binding protein [Aeromonas caviae]
MRRIIFYSWQSDIPSRLNRNIIEDALNRALKAIRRDETESLEPVLDRDTSGVPGSPSISDTIFKKISSADIFVADVTIINKNSDNKKTPNPNVLIELGFAISQLGWDRIILIQNSHFGGPEDLPFDLRGRRVVTYSFSSEEESKADIRGILQGRLESALKSALSDSSFGTLPTGPNAPIWSGREHTLLIF